MRGSGLFGRIGATPAGVARAGIVGVAIGAAMFLLLFVANRAALGLAVPAARAHVAQAFAQGTLQDRDYLENETDLGRHQYNDCLILRQAIDQRMPADRLAVSPVRDLLPPGLTQCASLRGFVSGRAPPDPTYYHRYLHGHTLLARLLLPHLSVGAIRTLYHGTVTLLIVAGITAAMLGLARGRRPVESAFWLILFLVFARWFGLETYGQSLGHAPADATFLGFLLILAIAGMRGGLSRRSAIVLGAIFGALTAIFEFLTGGIPLGMAAIVGGLPFAMHEPAAAHPSDGAASSPLPTDLPTPTDAFVAFCAAVATCLVLKVALVLYVFGGDAMADSAAQLRMRMGMDPTMGETVGVGAGEMLKKLVKGLDAMAPGMRLMAGSTLALAIAGGGWAATRLLGEGNDPLIRRRVTCLLLSNIAIVAMLALFWQHTVIHAWFMERTFAWTIATGFALFALAAGRRYGAGWAR